MPSPCVFLCSAVGVNYLAGCSLRPQAVYVFLMKPSECQRIGRARVSSASIAYHSIPQVELPRPPERVAGGVGPQEAQRGVADYARPPPRTGRKLAAHANANACADADIHAPVQEGGCVAWPWDGPAGQWMNVLAPVRAYK